MKVVTFFSHIGGASKSTLTREVGFELAARGLRVLLVDLDPQANLSSWTGVNATELNQTVYDTAVDDAPLPDPMESHGLHIIPANVLLSLAESRMLGSVGAQMSLRQHLRTEMQERYDAVLVDSPPSLGQLAVLGAIAADYLAVPMPCAEKGVLGLKGLTSVLPTYRRLNPDLTVSLYIPTQFDKRNSHDREMLAYYRDRLSPLATEIPVRSAFKDAQLARVPLREYEPRGDAYKSVVRLTDELSQAVGLPLEVTHAGS